MADDGDRQFSPQPMAGVDAEIAADIGDDGANGTTADLLGSGQVREICVGIGDASCGRPGGARSAPGWGAG